MHGKVRGLWNNESICCLTFGQIEECFSMEHASCAHPKLKCPHSTVVERLEMVLSAAICFCSINATFSNCIHHSLFPFFHPPVKLFCRNYWKISSNPIWSRLTRMNGSLLCPVLMYVQRSQNHGTGGLIGSSCVQDEAAAFIWPQFNQDRGVKQKASVFIIPAFPSAEPGLPQPRLPSGERSSGLTCLKHHRKNVGCRNKHRKIFLIVWCLIVVRVSKILRLISIATSWILLNDYSTVSSGRCSWIIQPLCRWSIVEMV